MSLQNELTTLLKDTNAEKVIFDKIEKHNYFISKCKREKYLGENQKWVWEKGEASGFEVGGLIDTTNMVNASYTTADITSLPEFSGALFFNERDLMKNGEVKRNFYKVIPGVLERFARRMEEMASIMFLADGKICNLTADGDATGIVTVDKPWMVRVGQRLAINDSVETAVEAYVTAVDINAKTVTLEDAASAGSAVDCSAFAIADGAHLTLNVASGASDSFTGLSSLVFPASVTGGSATILGLTKTSAPVLQAQYTSGAAFTSSNILDKLLDFVYDVQEVGRSAPSEILTSYQVFKECSRIAEDKRQLMARDDEPHFGVAGIKVNGPAGAVKITALRDIPNDKAYIVDWNELVLLGDKFVSNERMMGDKFFRTRTAGHGYGYQLITDYLFAAQLLAKRVSALGGVHSIPNPLV